MIPLRRGQIGVAVALVVMNAIGLVFIVVFAGFQSERRREGAPTVPEVQAAYDWAAVSAGSLHDSDLKVVQLDCRRSEGMRYSCRVDFVRAASDASQVFLDMAIVERQSPDGWRLLSRAFAAVSGSAGNRRGDFMASWAMPRPAWASLPQILDVYDPALRSGKIAAPAISDRIAAKVARLGTCSGILLQCGAITSSVLKRSSL